MTITIASPGISRYLVAVGNNQIWYEDSSVTAGTMTVVAASVDDIDTSDQCVMFEAYGKMFVVNGTKLKVLDFQNTKITTTNIGAHPPDRGNILTGGTSGAQMVVDYITSLTGACTIYGYRTTTAQFSAETVTGVDDEDNAISFTGTAGVTPDPAGGVPPHWYDWTVYGKSATYGTMPPKAYLGCLSGGRCVLSGNPNYPHECPASQAGNPWNWNTNEVNTDHATVVGTGDAGTIGDTVRALIPVRDGQLIIGCANSIHILIGNPADGGQLVAIPGIGVYGSHSWCRDADSNIYFWGTGGFNKLTAGSTSITNLNRITLPNLVPDTGADPSTHRITLGYDYVRGGVNIAITLLADGTSTNYWVDLTDPEVGKFFPDTHIATHGVFSQFYYHANDPADAGLLLGCTDGYMRVMDDETADDDGTAIDSYVTFGPLQLAEDGKDGSVSAIDVTLAGGASGSLADSDGATVEVWADDVAETVSEQLAAGTNPKLSLSFTGPGRAHGSKRRRGVRGAYLGIKIGNSATAETWGMEKIILDGGSPGRRVR
jgi:hypothetical protein